MKKSKFLAITAATAAVVMSLGACGNSSSSSAPSSDSSNVVLTVYGSEPENPLVPANTNETGGGQVIDLLFSGLVGFDTNGNAKNEVAKSITPNSDNTRYDIELKPDWTFTDGTKVTSQSFTKAWSYAANKKHKLVNSSWFSGIKGYKDLQADNTPDDAQLSGLKVKDDTHFSVELSEPTSTFPIQVGYSAFMPLPESFYKDPKAFGQNPVGNGSYKFKSWKHNQTISLVKNDSYKGVFPAKNAGIDFRIYTDMESAYSDIQAGHLDAMVGVPTSAAATFETDSAIQAYNKPGAVIQTLTIPSYLDHFGPGEEGRLRRAAVSRAIDRKAIVTKILGGTGTPAVDFITPKIPGYSENLKGSDVLKYDPKEAKKLWEDAEKIKPFGDSKITIAYNADGSHKAIIEAYVNSIKNALGNGVKVEAVAIPTFQELRQEINQRKLHSVFRSGWAPDYPSAENYLAPLYSSEAADGHGSNDGDYKNPEFDELLTKAAAASSTEEANKIYQQAEEILLKDLPAIPIYYRNNTGVAAKGVKNFSITW